MFLKNDKLPLGLALGIIVPMLIFVVLYEYRFSGYAFTEFTNVFFREKQLITFFGVWCLVGNIALFTFYINTGRDRTALGIFAVTVIYGIGVLLLKALI
ncbi:MAG: hypothetical protein JWP27_1277 [Flaviaesturariibacter sp.]|nr:hypothetical protein [Flaviaesturariibacter sp.]